MSRTPDSVARRLALFFGVFILVSVGFETALAAIASNPTQPAFPSPQTRFLLLSGLAAHRIELLGGVGLIALAFWSSSRTLAQKSVGLAYLVLAGLLLLPVVVLVASFRGYGPTELAPDELLRLRARFAQAVVFYPALSLTLASLGWVLLARSRGLRGGSAFA